MATRPNVFELKRVKADLLKQGVSDVEETISAMRLVIPAVIRELGKERIMEILEHLNPELGLSANSRWKQLVPDIVTWATASLESYKILKKSDEHAIQLDRD